MNDPRDRQDRIEALLRATGRRPVVPADRTDRVRATVHAHWETEVRRRARRRKGFVVVAIAAAIVVAVALGAWQRLGPMPNAEVAARVERVVGSAGSHLRSGDAVEAGSVLVTDDTGAIAFRLAGGHSVRLDSETRVQLLSARAITLERGAVYVDSRGAGGAAGFVEVRTALGVIRDLGTQFEVRRGVASLRVRVREGMIMLERTEASVEVTAGEELELLDDGRASRRPVAAFGPEWLWVGEVAPMLRVEGRSLKEFLDWVARERGLRLQFATEGIARSAREIRLSGSVEDMTLEQATESVLSTCGMSYRVDGDILRVRLRG